MNYADRLLASVNEKGNPCIVGLDPRIECMPHFLNHAKPITDDGDDICNAIVEFNTLIIQTVAPFVPGVKLQIAFYEQYGIKGLLAFQETIRIAKQHKLIVIVDAKRNDIASTAQAYANAFLGRSQLTNGSVAGFDVDCITVSPFLGRDSIEPFVDTCHRHDKGIFVLVKTSNRGSGDIQDVIGLRSRTTIYVSVAEMVNEIGVSSIGQSGYSSVGAVVGATFPDEAVRLRKLMPHAIFLVPGYGAQGGTAADAAHCFNRDGLGAVVNASRSIIYPENARTVAEDGYRQAVKVQIRDMIADIGSALSARKRSME